MSEQKMVRLTMRMPEKTFERISELQRSLGLSSVTVTIRGALAVYELIAGHVQAGNSVIIREPGGTEREVEILIGRGGEFRDS